MSSNDFNRIASSYDLLSSIVFGKSLKRSQCYFLNHIPRDSTVILLGDGSGTSLSYLLRHNACKEIIFIDASSVMIMMAKKRTAGISTTTNVVFIEKKIEDVQTLPLADTIVSPFLFDLFPEEKSDKLIKQYACLLKKDGLWVFTDFKKPAKTFRRFLQRLLLKAMYAFFRRVSMVEGNSLPDFDKGFAKAGLKKIAFRNFYFGMIETAVFASAGPTTKNK